MKNPLCIDLFCGLGGWTEGFLAEGYDCVGFDIERHQYPICTESGSGVTKNDKGSWFAQAHNTVSGHSKNPVHKLVKQNHNPIGWQRYPGQLVIQDALTIHGSQCRDAAVIVASPPCQKYSYMAMPWTRAKAMAADIRQSLDKIAELNALFDACFRIQREACAAAGRYIPLIVENVKGAQPWVGRAKWHYGSFYLWGDVPALMPQTFKTRMKCKVDCSPRRFDQRIAKSPEEAHAMHFRLPKADGLKNGSLQRRASSKSSARKAASAQIAKIPFALSQHIARCFRP